MAYGKLSNKLVGNGAFNIKLEAFYDFIYSYGQKSKNSFKMAKEILSVINNKLSKNRKRINYKILLLGYDFNLAYYLSKVKNFELNVVEEDENLVDFLFNLDSIEIYSDFYVDLYFKTIKYRICETKNILKINNFFNFIDASKEYDLIIFLSKKRQKLFYYSRPFLKKLINKSKNLIIITNNFEKKEFNKEFIVKRLFELKDKERLRIYIIEKDDLIIVNNKKLITI